MAKGPPRQVTSGTKENAMHALQRLRFVAERYTLIQDLSIAPLSISFLGTDIAADRQSIARVDLLTGVFGARLPASF